MKIEVDTKYLSVIRSLKHNTAKQGLAYLPTSSLVNDISFANTHGLEYNNATSNFLTY